MPGAGPLGGGLKMRVPGRVSFVWSGLALWVCLVFACFLSWLLVPVETETHPVPVLKPSSMVPVIPEPIEPVEEPHEEETQPAIEPVPTEPVPEELPPEPDLPAALPEETAPAAAADPLPRRFPIAGSSGRWLVLENDGSAWIEDGEGKRDKLDTSSAPAISSAAITAKYRRLTPAEAPKQKGELVVLERGVVEIAADEIITLLDEDRVVTRNSAGETSVYHADGRVERRERPLRVPQPEP